MLVDDGWYYLELATRLGGGQGSTFDGLSRTNGFHPAWLAALTIFAWLGLSPSAVVWWVSGTFLFTGTLLELSRCRALLVLGLVLSSFHGARIFFGGMEAPLAFCLVCATLWAWEKETRWSWLLGLLSGAAVTARWTNAALLAPLVVIAASNATWRQRASLCLAALTPLVVALAFSWIQTRHLVPVSAAIKTSGPPALGFGALAALPLGALVLWAWRSRRESVHRQTLPALALGLGLVTWADLVFRRVFIPEIWTLWPHVLVLCLIAERAPRWAVGAIIAGLLVMAGLSWTHRLNPESVTAYEAATRSGEWLEANTAPDAIAAGWDVGYIAGHTDRAVVNLDGLVNSWEFKEQVLDRNRLDEYLESELKPGYLAQDLPVAVLRRDPRVRFKGASIGHWYVRRAECFFFRAATSPWIRQHKVALVLSRGPAQPGERTLSEQRLELCSGDGA